MDGPMKAHRRRLTDSKGKVGAQVTISDDLVATGSGSSLGLLRLLHLPLKDDANHRNGLSEEDGDQGHYRSSALRSNCIHYEAITYTTSTTQRQPISGTAWATELCGHQCFKSNPSGISQVSTPDALYKKHIPAPHELFSGLKNGGNRERVAAVRRCALNNYQTSMLGWPDWRRMQPPPFPIQA